MSRLRHVPSDLERRLRTFWKCIWSLGCVLSALGRVYLLRIPLLTAIGIFGFCYLAFFTGFRLLLGNAFYLDSSFDISFVSTCAFLAAWAVVTTWRLVRLYGPESLLDTSSSPTSPNIGSMGLAAYALLFMVVALPPIGGAIYKSAELSLRWELFWIFAAFLMSLFVRAVVIGVQLLFTRQDIVRDSSDPGRFRPALVSPFEPVLDKALRLKAFPSLGGGITSLIRKLLKPHEGRGYVEHDEEGRVVSIQPGHVMAPPTSWHLTGKDKSAIQENWEAEIVKEHNSGHGGRCSLELGRYRGRRFLWCSVRICWEGACGGCPGSLTRDCRSGPVHVTARVRRAAAIRDGPIEKPFASAERYLPTRGKRPEGLTGIRNHAGEATGLTLQYPGYSLFI
jgi:hypothetical protein